MTEQCSKGGLVYQIEPGSLAEYLGIVPGDVIYAINGHVLRDEIDFRFYGSGEFITLDVIKADGTLERFEIEKDPDDLMGISFVNPVFDSIKTCRNNCCFCFISQLPRGMRRALYVRDDDYRLSFLFGNFISLTNLSEDDWKRIEEQRLSPLRVSLHTTDPGLRGRVMGNPEAARVMEHLRKLREMGIRAHIQIVLMKGINDGDNLVKTLDDLESLGDTILSVGVVPAVYSKYRRDLPSEPISSQWAGEVLDLIENHAQKVYKRRGIHWVYGADEFYLVSGKPIPDYEYYDDFPQFENGIGIVADFRETLRQILESAAPADTGGGEDGGEAVLAVTGYMAYPEIVSAVSALGLEDRISVLKVRNDFFGDTVTCAGLLSGRDILAAISELGQAGREYRKVLIPSYAVFEDKFLDDMTVSELSQRAGIPVEVVAPSPESLLDATSGRQRGQMAWDLL